MPLQLPGLQQQLVAAGRHDASSSFLRLPHRGSRCHMTATEACNATLVEQLARKTDTSLYCAAKDLILAEFWSRFKIPNAAAQSLRQHHVMRKEEEGAVPVTARIDNLQGVSSRGSSEEWWVLVGSSRPSTRIHLAE